MPQFDLVTFFNQVFWFFFGFFCFYFVTVYFFLPILCENLKYRKKKLENNVLFFKETGSEYLSQYAVVNSIFDKNGDFFNKSITDVSKICTDAAVPLIKQNLYSSFSFNNFLTVFLVSIVNVKKTIN